MAGEGSHTRSGGSRPWHHTRRWSGRTWPHAVGGPCGSWRRPEHWAVSDAFSVDVTERRVSSSFALLRVTAIYGWQPRQSATWVATRLPAAESCVNRRAVVQDRWEAGESARTLEDPGRLSGSKSVGGTDRFDPLTRASSFSSCLQGCGLSCTRAVLWSRIGAPDRVRAPPRTQVTSAVVASMASGAVCWPCPTWTLRGLACSATGMRTVSTPSWRSASRACRSRPSPSWIWRRKLPR